MEAIAEASDLAARRPSEHLRRSMTVDGESSSTLGGVVGREGSTPEHSAWSRDVYLSAATSFTVGRSRVLLRRGRVRLARKASEPSRFAWYPRQGPYLRTPKPGFAVASAKLASWFAAVAACHRAMQGIAGCSAARVKIGTMVTKA